MKKAITLILILLAVNSCDKDDSQLIESLDSEKLTVKKFQHAYETALEAFSRTQNIEKKNLMEIITTDVTELDRQLQPIHMQYQKKSFYESYRNMLMVKMAADKAGFTSRPEIKDILKYLEMQTVAQLYIAEEVEKKIKISEEDTQKECERLRAKDPRYKSLPVEKCLMFARAGLKAEETQNNLPKILERIKEGIAIKHNDKFDLDQFLKGDKSGSSSGSSDSSKPAENKTPAPPANGTPEKKAPAKK